MVAPLGGREVRRAMAWSWDAEDRIGHLALVALCFANWLAKDSTSWQVPALLGALACSLLWFWWRHNRDQLSLGFLLVAFSVVSPWGARTVQPFFSTSQQTTAGVARGLQERFSLLEGDLADWAKQVAENSLLQEALEGYGAGTLSEAAARLQIFPVLLDLEPPARLRHLEHALGVSVLGPSRELLAWAGATVESFDVDLDLVREGATFYVEDLALSAIKTVVPLPGRTQANGHVSVDLVVRKTGLLGEETDFQSLVELLEPPAGWQVIFIPRREAVRFLGAASDWQAEVALVAKPGRSLGKLLLKAGNQGFPLMRISSLSTVRWWFWKLMVGLLVVFSALVWGRGLQRLHRRRAVADALLLTAACVMLFFPAPEFFRGLRWGWGEVPELSVRLAFRGAIVLTLAVWSIWISICFNVSEPKGAWASGLSAGAGGALFVCWATVGDHLVGDFVSRTPIETWGPIAVSAVRLRMMGHFVVLAGQSIVLVLVAGLLNRFRSPVRWAVLLASSVVSLALGAEVWTAAWALGLVTLASPWAGSRFSRMRFRLLPAALVGLSWGFATTVSYFPLVEGSAREARHGKAVAVALSLVQSPRPIRGKFMERQLNDFLERTSLCTDLARENDELLRRLSALYWIESGLSRLPSAESSLFLLLADGTRASSFYTYVQDYDLVEQSFIGELLQRRRPTSKTVPLKDHTVQYVGSPVHCGGVLVGYVGMSLITGEFVELPPGLFEGSKILLVELEDGAPIDPSDPPLRPPITEGPRQVGGRIYDVKLLPVEGTPEFDHLAVLLRRPTFLKRLYNFLWAAVSSAACVVFLLLAGSFLLKILSPGEDVGVVLSFADKIFAGCLFTSLIPVLIISPVYRTILQDRLERGIKERGSQVSRAAQSMVLDAGLDLAQSLVGRFDGTSYEPSSKTTSAPTRPHLPQEMRRVLGREPILWWVLYDSNGIVVESAAPTNRPTDAELTAIVREVLQLGEPVATFASSRGRAVQLVVLPVSGEQPSIQGALVLSLRLFARLTDQLLLKARQSLGYEVELYSPDGFLQASSRWPYLQLRSPSRRIHPEAFYLMGVHSGEVHTVIRKQREQYRTFTTFRTCFSRSGRPSGFLAVSIDLSAREELVAELRDMGMLIFLIAFFGFLLSTFVATWLAGRLSRPLSDLMKATSTVASGNLDVRLIPRSDDEIGHLVTAFDSMVARLKKQRTELARSQRLAAWAEAARRVAHEIKNPLTPILLSIQHLRQVWDEGSPNFGPLFYRCSDTIVEQVKSLQRIATEFSRFARLPEPKLEPCDLNSVVKSAVAVFSEGLPDRIQLDLDLTDQNTRCNLDQEAISRTLVNLIQNAVHAIEKKGVIRMSTRPVDQDSKRMIRLRVEDSGSGISEEIQARLFEPYFSTKDHGTGLGLAIAKKTLDEHGCTIQVKSEMGRGTVFKIDFPALPQEPDPP